MEIIFFSIVIWNVSLPHYPLFKYYKMRRTLTLAVFMFTLSFSVHAQVVRVGLVGVGVGGGQNSGRFALHLLEASYAPQPRIDFGGYFGAALGASTDKASAGVRYGVQSKFYLMTEKFKPFVGLQAGLNSGGFVDVNTEEVATAGTKFQVTPQVGFRVGPLNIWASYQNGFMVNGGLVFGFGKFE
ncbi:hypothetical protein EGI26_08625 [Lacihabitans sp. CCS-44]|nr:hypothetical protein [Lacihabitans sp. CCS-44]